MPVIINIIICLLTILAFCFCGYYSLYRKSSLSKELDSIADACDSCTLNELPQQFTVFLAQRKLNYWGTILKELVGPSMLLSLIFSFIQWHSSLQANAGWAEVKQLVETPSVVFYANFALISYVTFTVFIIDQTIRSFSSAQKNGRNYTAKPPAMLGRITKAML